jgi:hypothetical protein
MPGAARSARRSWSRPSRARFRANATVRSCLRVHRLARTSLNAFNSWVRVDGFRKTAHPGQSERSRSASASPVWNTNGTSRSISAPAKGVINRLQFLVERLQLLLAGLQFLSRRTVFLIDRLQLLIGCTQLFAGILVILDRCFQAIAGRAQFLVKPAGIRSWCRVRGERPQPGYRIDTPACWSTSELRSVTMQDPEDATRQARRPGPWKPATDRC